MKIRNIFASITILLVTLAGTQCYAACCCATKIEGESLVLAATKPGMLCFDSIVPGSVVVRNAFDTKEPNTITYELNKDYTVDYNHGIIYRTAKSRIPDFSTNVLYGQKKFNHTYFPGYGNMAFFVYVDYQTANAKPFAVDNDQSALLAKSKAKLTAGGPFKLISYGDSIIAGGDAPRADLRFHHRYVEYLRELFPKAQITLDEEATAGDSTMDGVSRLEDKVLTHQPDMILIAFGMNDQNVGGVPVELFRSNLNQIIKRIRERTDADIMLITTFPPNPEWHYNSHTSDQFAKVTAEVAKANNCAFADVYSNWARVTARKDASSMRANNINHPTYFGHYIYLKTLEAVKF